jgi:hypothetical protein
VNTYTTKQQENAAVCSDPAGRFVIVWSSDTQDGSGRGVFGQRFFSVVVKAMRTPALGHVALGLTALALLVGGSAVVALRRRRNA